MWTLRDLATADELDTSLAAPQATLLFKHSPTCGVSAQANDDILQMLAGPALPVHMWRIPVQARRPLSNAVAARFGIRHESPQVILVKDGAVVWHASHFHVNAEEIRAALLRHLSTHA